MVGIHDAMVIGAGLAGVPAGEASADSANILRSRTVKTRRPSPLAILVAAVFALTGAGCSTIHLPPSALDQPGWVVRETAAIWRPRAAAVELAGELLSARHADGSRFVQFSKQGLPLVTARTTTNAWELSSPLRLRRYSGRLRRTGPPDRVPWFVCATLPPVPPASSRWQVVIRPDGSWRLLNPDTGESIEGVP